MDCPKRDLSKHRVTEGHRDTEVRFIANLLGLVQERLKRLGHLETYAKDDIARHRYAQRLL